MCNVYIVLGISGSHIQVLTILLMTWYMKVKKIKKLCGEASGCRDACEVNQPISIFVGYSNIVNNTE